MLQSIIVIGIGAWAGALLRWFLGLGLNAVFPTIPLGTLAANLIGGYLIGVAVAFLGARPELPPELRLLVITGFLGALTTFSTFSAEVVTLMQTGRLGWAVATVALHVVGSVTLTLLGYATVTSFFGH
jgi:CrcB protein